MLRRSLTNLFKMRENKTKGELRYIIFGFWKRKSLFGRKIRKNDV